MVPKATMDIKEWFILLLQILTILSIVYSGIKVISRNIDEWAQREARLKVLEERVDGLSALSREVVTTNTKLTDMANEISRVRDRLDRFLDIRSSLQTPPKV